MEQFNEIIAQLWREAFIIHVLIVVGTLNTVFGLWALARAGRAMRASRAARSAADETRVDAEQAALDSRRVAEQRIDRAQYETLEVAKRVDQLEAQSIVLTAVVASTVPESLRGVGVSLDVSDAADLSTRRGE